MHRSHKIPHAQPANKQANKWYALLSGSGTPSKEPPNTSLVKQVFRQVLASSTNTTICRVDIPLGQAARGTTPTKTTPQKNHPSPCRRGQSSHRSPKLHMSYSRGQGGCLEEPCS
jgi:hypothetical protein